jgi:hypothetical protein
VNAAAALALQGVRKTFAPDTPNEVRALQGIDLEVAPGSFVIVIGATARVEPARRRGRLLRSMSAGSA